MLISTLLKAKGSDVATVPAATSVSDVLAKLAEHGIGALVVSDDGTSIHGIVSERDVVRRLHERGPDVLSAPVSEIMTVEVHTCGPNDAVEDLMAAMTEH